MNGKIAFATPIVAYHILTPWECTEIVAPRARSLTPRPPPSVCEEAVFFHDPALAALLTLRLASWISGAHVHDAFRLYLQTANGREQPWHTDDPVAQHRSDENGKLEVVYSHNSLLLYMNDGFSGGATEFKLADGTTSLVQPHQGAGVMFSQQLVHRGLPLAADTLEKRNPPKLVLRTTIISSKALS